ncbi:hypothetical protein GGR56DRAFT_694012 [Xylariaceae sp. FL0804]|nr:hypothetical protein GGR56DRAFT_694012 [Xylariaceae sp. FL0804]
MATPQSTLAPEDVLAQVQALVAKQELTILKLSEPITSEVAQLQQDAHNSINNNDLQRTSDISASSLAATAASEGGATTTTTTTPASLEADLAHYRELFAKLRFSYVEQVTKEKFIRAIVGDPPLIVGAAENAALERDNAAAKAGLKRLKADVAAHVAALEARAGELVRRHERAARDAARLEALPREVRAREAEVARLRAAAAAAAGGGGGARGDDDNEAVVVEDGKNPELNLPLARTADLVDERRRRRGELDRELAQLRARVPRRRRELELLHAELQPLEARRQGSGAAAREARRRKEAALGGVEDELEARGRWYRAADAGLRRMLEIEG